MTTGQTRHAGRPSFLRALAIATCFSAILWLIIVAIGYMICRWWWT